jgi:hypothetical protein
MLPVQLRVREGCENPAYHMRSMEHSRYLVGAKRNFGVLCYPHTEGYPQDSKIFAQCKHFVYTSRATSRLTAAPALHRPRRAPRVLVSHPHGLYVNLTVHRDNSSSGLHRLYCAYAVHPDAPSRRSTSRQSVALALAVCPVIPLCIVTTRRPDCTGPTAPMPCIRTRRLDARLLVSRSHWLLPCARSFRCAS